MENLLIAYFARLNYNYKGKYILSASIRQEGSTKFGKNYKWGTFPAVSVAWNIVEENFNHEDNAQAIQTHLGILQNIIQRMANVSK